MKRTMLYLTLCWLYSLSFSGFGQDLNKENLVGFWLNCNGKKRYEKGDTIRFTKTDSAVIHYQRANCSEQQEGVEVWEFTKKELHTDLNIEKESGQIIEESGLYYPWKASKRNRQIRITTKNYKRAYDVVQFDGKKLVILRVE